MSQLIDFFQHIPEYLEVWAGAYGPGLYLILFLIIFAETGLVVTPFLPGDSLLFATGAVMALGLPGLNVGTMIGVLFVAAVLGDMVNYHIGKWMAPRLFRSSKSRWLNTNHLEKTREFYDRHGGKTVVLARFLPIIRTYAPFVAGMSGMRYSDFFVYNIAGGAIWISSFIGLGFFFGNLPAVKSNFQYVILAIIVLSVLPIVFEWWRERQRSTSQS
ncbi:MAG: DedA family protein [Bdellovibrionales bacterium]